MDDYREFIRKLVQEEPRPASPAELEALLHWLVGRRNNVAEAVERAFNGLSIPTAEARRRTLRYLDRTLFRHNGDYYRLLGLTPDCSLSAIRARHKQLLQSFHPDRHTTERDWFTERAEQLNRAYAYLKANHGKPRAVPRPHNVPPKQPVARRARAAGAVRPGTWKSLAAFKGWARRKLKTYVGDPGRFERRLYVVLYSIPVLLLGGLYLSQMEFADYQSRALPSGARENASEPDNAGRPSRYRYPDSAKDPVKVKGENNTALPFTGGVPRGEDAARELPWRRVHDEHRLPREWGFFEERTEPIAEVLMTRLVGLDGKVMVRIPSNVVVGIQG